MDPGSHLMSRHVDGESLFNILGESFDIVTGDSKAGCLRMTAKALELSWPVRQQATKVNAGVPPGRSPCFGASAADDKDRAAVVIGETSSYQSQYAKRPII